MSWVYLDTSALVKRYFWEVGSNWVKGLLQPQRTLAFFIKRNHDCGGGRCLCPKTTHDLRVIFGRA